MGVAPSAVNGNQFRHLTALGYTNLVSVIPPKADVRPGTLFAKRIEKGIDARGKMPGERGSDGFWYGMKGWAARPRPTEAEMDRWYADGANVGFKNDGSMFILDIDAYRPEHAAAVEDIALRLLGPAPCRIGEAPKRALFYRSAGAIDVAGLQFDGGRDAPDRVEVSEEGKHIVMFGTHPKTMRPYDWPRPMVPYDQLAPVTQDMAAAFFAEVRAVLPEAKPIARTSNTDRSTVNQAALEGDIDMVRRAVEATPNDPNEFGVYESHVKWGEAIHGACAKDLEAGRDIWIEWAVRWPEYDYDTAYSRWDSFTAPHSVGASFIYETAERLSGGKFSRAMVYFDHEAAAPAIEAGATKAAEARERFRLQSLDEVADEALANAVPPLVAGLLDCGAMSVLYGDSNVGKTFVAMDLAFRIGAGMPYRGGATMQGNVVYLVLEGGRGASQRLAALRQFHGEAGAGSRVWTIRSPANLREPDADIGPLMEVLERFAAAHGGIALLVVDTLARAMAGGEENSSVDMGVMVRHFDALRAALACHLMVIHHTGKDAARGARGHSSLRAAVDTEIEVAEGKITVTKQRDMEKAWSAGFVLRPVPLGMNNLGEMVTGAVAEVVDIRKLEDAAEAGRTPEAPRKAEAKMLEAIRSLRKAGETVTPALAGRWLAEQGVKITNSTARVYCAALVNKGLARRLPDKSYEAIELQAVNSASDMFD